MSYIANTSTEKAEMLKTIGVSSVEDLFIDIPEKVRFPKVNLPPGLSEQETLDELQNLSRKNGSFTKGLTFLGGGVYNHYIPSVVDALSSRGEFLTAYTPYQPEASQGTLQYIFEYQTMVGDLTGMEVVNASHYDGATAMAEAVLMSIHVSRDKRKKVVLSPDLNPEYISTMKMYLQAMDIVFQGDESRDAEHSPDPMSLAGMADEETACVVIQTPDFFGRLKDLAGVAEKVHEAGALLIVHIDPLSLGLFKSPGSCGADIVTGEGQPLGIPLGFGGPYLGIFACRKEFIRKMPGRLAGQTVDTEGSRGYVLTLNTREQHIKRERATSNICTNQGLMVLRAAIYLAAMGPRGIRKTAETCYHRAKYAADAISSVPGFSVTKDAPFFREFAVTTPIPAEELVRRCALQGVHPGLALSRYYDSKPDRLLVCVTEMNTKQNINTLIQTLKEVTK